MYRILVVDDEEMIRSLIRKYAEFEGNQVTEAENGMEAVELCRRHPGAYDIIIMDVMMPELDGFSAVAEIRKTCNTPVLMLSARGEEYDRIHGFELGVDDYVVKPFSPKELMMRVTAIMNRVNPQGEEHRRNVLTFEGLSIDLDARIVTVDGQRVELSPRSTTCWCTWPRTRTSPSPGRCSSPTCGATTSTATTARWTPTSSCCAAPWGPTASLLSP